VNVIASIAVSCLGSRLLMRTHPFLATCLPVVVGASCLIYLLSRCFPSFYRNGAARSHASRSYEGDFYFSERSRSTTPPRRSSYGLGLSDNVMHPVPNTRRGLGTPTSDQNSFSRGMNRVPEIRPVFPVSGLGDPTMHAVPNTRRGLGTPNSERQNYGGSFPNQSIGSREGPTMFPVADQRR